MMTTWSAIGTANNDYTQYAAQTDQTFKLFDYFNRTGTYLGNPYERIQIGITNVLVSGATIIPESKPINKNVINLSSGSDINSLLQTIINAPQSGEKLLSFSGAFKGEKDMSSDKKKYLNGSK